MRKEKGVILMKPKKSECMNMKNYTFDSQKNCYIKKRSKRPLIITGIISLIILGLAAIVIYSLSKQNAMEYAYHAVIESENNEITEVVEDKNKPVLTYDLQQATEYVLSQNFSEMNIPTVSPAVAPLEKRNLVTSSNKEPINKGEAEYSFVTENFQLSDADREALIRIVEAEATGEDIIGKILVANVVLNRVRSRRFPNSVYDVVFQPRQFSPITDGRYFSVPIRSSTYEAVDRALAGEDYSNGALFFVARSMADKDNVDWFDAKLTKVYQHGVHEFFTY